MFASKDLFFTPSAAGYRISNSLRFRSSASAYLNRTPGSTSNQKTWTWSGWIKRGVMNQRQGWFSAGPTTSRTDANVLQFGWQTNDIFQLGLETTYVLQSTNVFRDPSAWYHFVIAFDSTQATASNRIRVYVNNTEITAWSTDNRSSAITQNGNFGVNLSANPHYVGTIYSGLSQVDGYLAEVNFIDGQALTPSSFGAYDTNGVWQPAQYTGSYGTNGFYLPYNNFGTSTYAAPFNGSSQYLTFPNSSNFAFGTGAFTIEGFITASSALNDQFILGGRNAIGTMHITTGGSSSTAGSLRYVGSSTITTGTYLICDGSWHHFAITRDGSNNINLWIDGVSRGSGTDTTNYTTTSGTWYFARADLSSAAFLGATLSNFRMVKGTAVYTSTFTPPTSNLTAISGTSILTLQSSTIIDNSGNSVSITNNGSVATSLNYPFKNTGPGADSSGNTNNWTSWNINTTSSSDTTYDSMIDSPTNYADGGNGRGNYAVLNPIIPVANTSIASANLNFAVTTASWRNAISTIGASANKYYFEATVLSTTNAGIIVIGAGNSTLNFTGSLGSDAYGWAWQPYSTSYKYNNGVSTAVGGAITVAVGDVLQCAFDLDNSKIWFGRNNTWAEGSPSAGTTPSFSNLSGAIFGAVGILGDATGTANTLATNFGQRPFTYTPPSGFSALNTQNLTTPPIAAGNKYFDATTYTGNGSTQSITNSSSFQPDLVWVKGRSAALSNIFQDTIRGAGKSLVSNTTAAETGLTGDLISSFNSNGFTVNTNLNGGSDNSTNLNAGTFVGWQWKGGGGTGVSNTSGSITSTVSANTSAGFSIVTYSGSGSNATVGHGLGVAPSMIIVKCRSAAFNWAVYHSSLTSAAYYLSLNQTIAATNNSTLWNSTAPTSTVFSVGTAGDTNAGNLVAYCFAAVAGYSAFGSYTGNGSADGPFVYTGFRPRYVLIKRTDSTSDWYVWDTARDTYNVMSATLFPDTNGSETSATSIDGLSNGFKCRSATVVNVSSGTYIYAAFAENPFKISRAR